VKLQRKAGKEVESEFLETIRLRKMTGSFPSLSASLFLDRTTLTPKAATTTRLPTHPVRSPLHANCPFPRRMLSHLVACRLRHRRMRRRMRRRPDQRRTCQDNRPMNARQLRP
jgi:hypothetical protein